MPKQEMCHARQPPQPPPAPRARPQS
jgi:hypothetical protein